MTNKCYGGISYDRLGRQCPKCSSKPNEACGYIGVYVGMVEGALKDFVAHYPVGVNPSLDEAYKKARAVLKTGGVDADAS